MQPASTLTKYNVVVIWSPYAPIVSQGAIMTSESLPARLSDPGRGTIRRGKKDGTDWPCMLEALSYGHRGVFLLPGKNIYTPALPVVAWWWFSARPRSSSMVVQAARVASGQFSRQGGDHGPTLPPAQSGALCHTQRPSTLLRPFSVLLQLTSSCLHSFLRLILN